MNENEWTAEYVQTFGTCRKIANAHNAAIAAVVDRAVGYAGELAAERENAEKAAARAELAQIALAAEKKTVKEYEDYIKSLDRIAGIEAE